LGGGSKYHKKKNIVTIFKHLWWRIFPEDAKICPICGFALSGNGE